MQGSQNHTMQEYMNIIVKNGLILTMDADNSVIEDGYICIKDDYISHLGSGPCPFQTQKTLDANGGIILPGLINGHTHVPMSLFRGIADDLPLMEWLNNYIFPLESHVTAEFVYTGAMLACAEMIMTGTTTFCDMYMFEDEVARAAYETGMRCVVGEGLFDFDSPNYGPLKKGLVYTEELISKWHDSPTVNISVDPHSVFTCAPDLLITANELALKHDTLLVIHLAETLAEVKEVEDRYGKKPVQYLDSLGILGPHLIAAHCVHLDEEEINLLADNHVKIIHNPESNMKLASGVSPVPRLLASGITVGIGTDGCASNNNLDLFAEMDVSAKLHKLANMDPTVMTASEVLHMATIEGAKALSLDTVTGSLEQGKKADIIVVDTSQPNMVPMYNPCSNLVYSASGANVIHSIINGQIVMYNRELLSFDLCTVIDNARAFAKRIR